MTYHLPNRVLTEIRKFARQHGIRKILLFGSRARGTHTERSDIDLAVMGGDVDAFCLDLREKVHSLLMFDVVNLDEKISEELSREIERDGIIIYEKTG